MYGEILDEVVNYMQDGDGEDHVGRIYVDVNLKMVQ